MVSQHRQYEYTFAFPTLKLKLLLQKGLFLTLSAHLMTANQNKPVKSTVWFILTKNESKFMIIVMFPQFKINK